MDAEAPAGSIVVVIDVIRAFTTAAVAFERGATDIYCTPSIGAALRLRQIHTDRILVGEERGLKPADFDFGNSPYEMSKARLVGRGLIQATSNGTLGLARPQDVAALLATSAVNVGATARWIDMNHARTPCVIVCTGRTAEDWVCARYLRDVLEGMDPRPADLIEGIRRGAAEHAQAYSVRSASERVDLSFDLPFCNDIDRSDFAMVAHRDDNYIAVEAVRC
ncbi:2-phosphosulfolactate phosphatase [Actinoplanes sp. KI2]|uniref:2-phosphosulfolactate phosphatase n=1 Tax=Actinoplanes sp. KI2 TaxID=2983315 RepID=UPI0021D5763F|nr:2-phosphosulfolactate phosphatase [Actinoplanes sp. KI2]MCU7729885.1 2-phosphosulfolactate phosphatase [Actinoplanes sp. KI2]